MTTEVAFGAYEYRMQGGEIHRRPVEKEGLAVWDAAWLVLDKKTADIPPVVLNNLKSTQRPLRFD